ncbi:grasp-with-spasm system SPASM domain peptide maturase [Marinoscillum pacificum]|uniref:grasp-with-spasm system SPASM domain peptide maturase n=1 Tax=Marinoscillum pacificum TaxID=392723 RepID=UPI002157B6A7|nr:grasp-with-spasm system SPASM domain peptide maturase [Marinoscillum pacificum]
MTKDYFILHGNCIPVKGATRSIICDLQLGKYKYIPNELYDILNLSREHSITDLEEKFDLSEDGSLFHYFEALVKSGYGIFTNTPELFPVLDLEFATYSEVTNAIIDYNSTSTYNLISVIKQLEGLVCEAVQIRNFDGLNIDILEKISTTFSESSIPIFEIILKHDIIVEGRLESILENNSRFRYVIVHSSPVDKSIEIKNSKVHFTKKSIDSSSHCGQISSFFFTVNIESFTEALAYNSCLNKKISIDTNGEIKNCPSFEKSFGIINNTKLVDVLRNLEFKKVWKINKDQISTCKDCEFRYICTDCRAYTKNGGLFDKPQKCSYNPYIGEWEN